MRLRQAIVAATLLLSAAAAPAKPASYSDSDFARVRKIDGHVHANVERSDFLAIAGLDGFGLLSINVDYPDFPPLPLQAHAAEVLQRSNPARFHFATAFSMDGFGTPGWTERTIAQLDKAFAEGAVAVKVWKNIGMVAKDAEGKRVFIDDPRFDGVMRHLEERGIPLIAHQGEPKNCWLPLEQMSTENDRSYFREHPEYYMYLHPEEPSYEQLMAARDRFVARHPKLSFVGAHMASLEWDVDVLARFLDTYPNANVDLAARMTQVQAQSREDYAKVRRFFIKYQDRLIYGSDLADNPPRPGKASEEPSGSDALKAEADHFWRSDWRYLATDRSQRIEDIHATVKGLALPRSVIDKIYFANAQRVFKLN